MRIGAKYPAELGGDVKKQMPIWWIAIILTALAGPGWCKGQEKYDDLNKKISFEKLDELQVEIEIGVAELNIAQCAEDLLFEGKIHYLKKRGEPRIEFNRSGKTGYLIIKSADSGDHDEHTYKGLSSSDETWDLRFNSKIPIRFDIEVGLVDGTVDLTGMRVANLTVSSGLSNLELSFFEPNAETLQEMRIECGLGDFKGVRLGNANFRRMRVEGGLGSVKLDLSGQWRQPETQIKVEVGLGSARLEIPASLGVEVTAQDNFLSSLEIDRGIREIRKGLYRTANWEDAGNRLIIDAEVGLGSFKIKRTE
jgi:hypothetical protein